MVSELTDVFTHTHTRTPIKPPCWSPPPSGPEGLVAVVVGLEGPLGGQAQVLGLLVGQFGQLHSEFVQVSRCHLLIQLLKTPTQVTIGTFTSQIHQAQGSHCLCWDKKNKNAHTT